MDEASGGRVIAGLPAFLRTRLEPALPHWIEARWLENTDDAIAKAPGLEIGWFDFFDDMRPRDICESAADLRWLSAISAGIEHMPLDLLQARAVRLTNGNGINDSLISEYAVMGVLVAAKRFDHVVRAHDKAEWLTQPPARIELDGSRALVIGYGAIGQAIADRLRPFGMQVDGVRRTPVHGSGEMAPHEWQSRVGEYDFLILAAPATTETVALVDADVIAAMKPTAWLVNIARGALIAREPLLDALSRRAIGGAFLDVTDPEPLPPDDPLWKMPDAIITMHLSGRSQTRMWDRGVALFLANLALYRRGEPMQNEVDLARGY